MVAFCFTLVFIYDIASIYIANILYYILLIKETIKKKGTLSIKKNKPAKYFYFTFVIWVTFSTFLYSFEHFTSRTIIQYLFTLQYFVLLINIRFPVEKFELWIYRFSLLLALEIIIVYAYFFTISPLTLTDELWAVKYIPGWPNSVPIPLLIGLWLSFRKHSHILIKSFLFIALVLTTSRIGLLGGLIIIGYFLLKNRNKFWIASFLLSLFVILIYVFIKEPLIIGRLIIIFDRIDIFWTTMRFIEQRPIWGFGGNTIDQLMNIIGDPIALKNWEQTHNWLLEILLRYGIGGVIIFMGFIVSIFVHITDNDRKFMFLLLILVALFQTYIRDFVFLCYLAYLSNEGMHEKREHLYKKKVDANKFLHY